MQARAIDIAILGGGLSGGMIALAFAQARPDLRVVLIEAGERCGGNHVWSFFGHDVDPADEALVAPLVVRRWPGYQVRFPRHARRLDAPYNSVTGERLDEHLRATLPPGDLLTGSAVRDAGPTHCTLADGTRIEAGGVIDARGQAGLAHMAGGWQKFVGQMLTLARPHGIDVPVVMDATVDQIDGYRFVYCLPFSATEIFVEDTYYADGPALDHALLRQRIADYAAAQGWPVAHVSREEAGVLPVIATGDFAGFWAAGDTSLARAGTRAALVHPLTGYSLPDAVRFARHLAALDDLSGASLARSGYAYARSHWRRGAFDRMLARMLFGAALPKERYKVLERFYTLPERVIERFYAGRAGWGDRLRIVAGKPPVPVAAAVASLAGGGRRLAPLEGAR